MSGRSINADSDVDLQHSVSRRGVRDVHEDTYTSEADPLISPLLGKVSETTSAATSLLAVSCQRVTSFVLLVPSCGQAGASCCKIVQIVNAYEAV